MAAAATAAGSTRTMLLLHRETSDREGTDGPLGLGPSPWSCVAVNHASDGTMPNSMEVYGLNGTPGGARHVLAARSACETLWEELSRQGSMSRPDATYEIHHQQHNDSDSSPMLDHSACGLPAHEAWGAGLASGRALEGTFHVEHTAHHHPAAATFGRASTTCLQLDRLQMQFERAVSQLPVTYTVLESAVLAASGSTLLLVQDAAGGSLDQSYTGSDQSMDSQARAECMVMDRGVHEPGPAMGPVSIHLRVPAAARAAAAPHNASRAWLRRSCERLAGWDRAHTTVAAMLTYRDAASTGCLQATPEWAEASLPVLTGFTGAFEYDESHAEAPAWMNAVVQTSRLQLDAARPRTEVAVVSSLQTRDRNGSVALVRAEIGTSGQAHLQPASMYGCLGLQPRLDASRS